LFGLHDVLQDLCPASWGKFTQGHFSQVPYPKINEHVAAIDAIAPAVVLGDGQAKALDQLAYSFAVMVFRARAAARFAEM
jgi:hypothetical protein